MKDKVIAFSAFWERYGRFFAFGVGLGLIILGLALAVLKQTKSEPVEFLSGPTEKEENKEVVVDVGGAVFAPGVYRLKEGSRVAEAIEKAGGLGENADKDWVAKNLNLARVLQDGEKIYIPKKGEVLGENTGGNLSNFQSQSSASKLVNLNTATLSELQSLPGIGPSFAQKIIDYRVSHGGFKSLEEIQAVSGIGKKTFEKIKDKITI